MKAKRRIGKKRVPVGELSVVRAQVAGVDIGSKEHWVCAPEGAEGTLTIRSFGPTTPKLIELADWLQELRVESVAMESTSVYWIPLYELLESRGIEVVLVDGRKLHNVPGRKTDVLDCQWIQLLHSRGLLAASFRPEEAVCRLRALHRQLANLVEERTKAVQWMQKALDQMNVLVHRAVSDITGTTGMAIVRAIVAGERDASKLAKLRDPRCQKPLETIAEYLTGTWRPEHLFNLKSALSLYDHLSSQILDYEGQLEKEMHGLVPPERQGQNAETHANPQKQKAMKRRGELERRDSLFRLAGVDLTQIDGISVGTATVVLTEVGPRLAAFPSERHFVSWLGLAPRTAISGGKPLTKKNKGFGATRTAAALRMAALTLCRSQTALGAAYRRVARRHGGKVAVFSIARKLAQLVYRMLRHGQEYLDIGAQAYEDRFNQRRLAALTASARQLGLRLIPEEAAEGVSG